jgi:hypothetical protein
MISALFPDTTTPLKAEVIGEYYRITYCQFVEFHRRDIINLEPFIILYGSIPSE